VKNASGSAQARATFPEGACQVHFYRLANAFFALHSPEGGKIDEQDATFCGGCPLPHSCIRYTLLPIKDAPTSVQELNWYPGEHPQFSSPPRKTAMIAFFHAGCT
jgi:hypothetical protein